MPMKLCLGLSRKVGQPDFGSLGASCGVELEIDSRMLSGDLDGFREKVRAVYAACNRVIDEELSRQQSNSSRVVGSRNEINRRIFPQRTRKPATPAQVRALRVIGSRVGVDLPELVRERFGFERPEELSIREASRLIDELKSPDQSTI